MAHDLETPPGEPGRWAEQLYRARGEAIPRWRPVFTGDVFDAVPVTTSSGTTAGRTVMVLQHPCAMRTDGVNLATRLLVSEVRHHRVLTPEEWRGFTKLMSLPDLNSSETSRRRHQAVMFDKLEVVDSAALDVGRRLACLTHVGVNLLLQRRVHYDTRVVVPTHDIQAVTGGVYEEADIIEDWCEAASLAGIDLSLATDDCVIWLREDLGDGLTRQRMLEDQQNRSGIRRAARAETVKRYGSTRRAAT